MATYRNWLNLKQFNKWSDDEEDSSDDSEMAKINVPQLGQVSVTKRKFWSRNEESSNICAVRYKQRGQKRLGEVKKKKYKRKKKGFVGKMTYPFMKCFNSIRQLNFYFQLFIGSIFFLFCMQIYTDDDFIGTGFMENVNSVVDRKLPEQQCGKQQFIGQTPYGGKWKPCPLSQSGLVCEVPCSDSFVGNIKSENLTCVDGTWSKPICALKVCSPKGHATTEENCGKGDYAHCEWPNKTGKKICKRKCSEVPKTCNEYAHCELIGEGDPQECKRKCSEGDAKTCAKDDYAHCKMIEKVCERKKNFMK